MTQEHRRIVGQRLFEAIRDKLSPRTRRSGYWREVATGQRALQVSTLKKWAFHFRLDWATLYEGESQHLARVDGIRAWQEALAVTIDLEERFALFSRIALETFLFLRGLGLRATMRELATGNGGQAWIILHGPHEGFSLHLSLSGDWAVLDLQHTLPGLPPASLASGVCDATTISAINRELTSLRQQLQRGDFPVEAIRKNVDHVIREHPSST